MKQKFTASICQEDEWFVAQCIEVDVASQGRTEDEALENLRDVLELHFTQPVASLGPQIRSIEIELFESAKRTNLTKPLVGPLR